MDDEMDELDFALDRDISKLKERMITERIQNERLLPMMHGKPVVYGTEI